MTDIEKLLGELEEGADYLENIAQDEPGGVAAALTFQAAATRSLIAVVKRVDQVAVERCLCAELEEEICLLCGIRSDMNTIARGGK